MLIAQKGVIKIGILNQNFKRYSNKREQKKWKMNNGLQKIGKVDYDRGFRRKLRDMIAIFKRYSKEKSQKNLNIRIMRYKTPLNPV